MKDEDLRKQVIDELRCDPGIRDEDINVAVSNGVVSLSGHASSYGRKTAAEFATRRLTDVRAVANEIDVKLPPGATISDSEIARRAGNVLEWNSILPAGRVHVAVNNGWITLSGEVDWQYQRSAAADAVRPLPGVAAVVNNISVKPQVQVRQVRDRIEDALKRNAESRAASISVAVCGPIVTLHGKVHDWEERMAVRNAAALIPGVKRVEDLLTVA